MDKKVAQHILQIALSFSGDLDHSVAVVEASSDPAAAKAYRRAVARVLTDVLTEIFTPIYNEHPDLIPKELQ